MIVRLFLISVLVLLSACLNKTSNTEHLLVHFIEKQEEKAKAIHQKISWATLKANSQAGKADSLHHYYQTIQHCEGTLQELRSGIDHLYSDMSEYAFLKGIKSSGVIQDKLLIRQVDNILQLYEDRKLGYDSLEMAREDFCKYLVANDPLKFQADEWRRNDTLFNQYSIHIQEIHSELQVMLKAFNRFAKKGGCKNYYEWMLNRNGIDSIQYKTLFKQVEEITRADYLQLKSLAEQFWMDSLNCTSDRLNLLHYNYFFSQLRLPYNWQRKQLNSGVMKKVEAFWGLMGVPFTEVSKRLAFDELESGKANMTILNCDNYYDVRGVGCLPSSMDGLLMLIRESCYPVAMMAVDDSVPYFLREPDPLLLEAMSCYYEQLFYYSDRIRCNMHIAEPQFGVSMQFSNPWFLFSLRNLLVMAEMERDLYVNPDQDLTELFWSKVEKYLFIDVPAPFRHMEWVKHERLLTLTGANQLNLYGMILAAQFHQASQNQFSLPSELPYLLFQKGDSDDWDEIVQSVCGERINPRYVQGFYKKL